ncbi:hypothetical protein Z957_00385 [Clostridium sp. K25]|uniref:hypothetical protein n=1 Tax=Clostridium sp. K25 TaxID=1443109 RepID=UPI0004DA9D5F|nr:hypothetical protein [Clostridium sp. K25]KEI10223.1 hypothetical protein Z957_00385 [Clostridium sp. K25]
MISNINETQEVKQLEYENYSYSNVLTPTLINCNSSSPDLYADNNSNSESITVYNKGAYVAFLSWGYYLNDKYCSFESPYIPVLQSFKIDIPSEATGINLLALISFDFSEFDIICRKEYAKPSTKCFSLWGTIFYYGCSEIPCPSNMVGGSPIPPGNNTSGCK